MRRAACWLLFCVFILVFPSSAAGLSCTLNTADPSITICQPANGAAVTSPVRIEAGAYSSKPVTGMIVYLDWVEAYRTSASQVDTTLPMSPGTHKVLVKAWNSSGASFSSLVTITVSSGTPPPCSLNPTDPSVTICAPQNGATVTSPVRVVAGTTSSKLVTGMIVYVDWVEAYRTSAGQLDTSLPMAAGAHRILVKAWNSSGVSFSSSVSVTVSGGGGGDISQVKHILIMLQENRSFDHYFGKLGDYRVALGLPREIDGLTSGHWNPDDNEVPVYAFRLNTVCIENLTPAWNEAHGQANRWNPSSDVILLDGFVHTAAGYAQFLGMNDRRGVRAMGYYDWNHLPYYYWMATQFSTSDRFFPPVPGGSAVNRMYLIAGTSAGVAKDPVKTYDVRTIFHLLEERGISWKVYYTDLDPNGRPATRLLTFQPFADQHASKIVPLSQYFTDLQNGTLPAVALIETGYHSGRDEHPGGANIQVGAAYVANIINSLMQSSAWSSSVFFWTFDEWGGLFDHVPPMMNVPNPDGIPPLDLTSGDYAQGDFTRTGFRIPMFVVSPFARKHYVSHTPMDFTAILKFIETRHDLPALTARDAFMPDMTEFFDFLSPPWMTPPPPPAQPTDGACYLDRLP